MNLIQYLDTAAKRYIDEVLEDVEEHWQPGLGYGWTDSGKAQRKTSALLANSEQASVLANRGLTQWGIKGEKIRGSHFAFIGTWASMLDYYYDSYFLQKRQTTSKHDMDRQVLWAQQSIEISSDADEWKSNLVNAAYNASKSPGADDLFQLLSAAYQSNKTAFKNDAWTSFLNISGPGEQTVYANVQNAPLNSMRIKDLADEARRGPRDMQRLQAQLENIDSHTEITNMAWLEDLFTRQAVPIILYNKLNVDELAAARLAVRYRDQFVCEKYEEMTLQLGGNASPGRVLLFLYKKLLECFYGKLYRAHRRKFINSKQNGFHRITSNESTISRLKRAQTGFECIKISGLLKIAPPDRSKIRLTGTGKEFFYLLAKGATPFICGEFLILSPTQDAGQLAQKLASIPQKLKFNLQNHYHPMKEGLLYSSLVRGITKPMPFITNNPAAIKRQLFRLSALPAFSCENLFGW